jgi:DNA-binding Lrp family transcriptional regulator
VNLYLLLTMDDIDRKILNDIQSAFPIASRPYLELGKRLGLPEEEVLERVKRMRSEGIIRRIGANFNSKRLGFTSSVCAARVPEKKIKGFVRLVNGYKGVTHNYLRGHDYNVWFTLIAPSTKDIEDVLNEISEKTGVKGILNLPAIRTFKIKVDLQF